MPCQEEIDGIGMAGPMNEFSERQAELAATPVEIPPDGGEIDPHLDDHLWLRVLKLVPGIAPDEVGRLQIDVQAYFLTRLFEWETGSGGPLAFFDNSGDLAGLVAAPYRHLGLDRAAEVYETLLASDGAQRVMDDRSYMPSDSDLAVAGVLVDEIGDHDADRLVFVLSRPAVFSI